jgi:adenylate kinase
VVLLGDDTFAAIALLGGPGAGKGTLARRLVTACGIQHVDLGQLLRARSARDDPAGRRIHRLQAQGQMVPKELVLEVLNDHLENCDPGAPLILDGFPRTTAQLAASDDGRVPITIERAVWLDVPRTIAEARLRQRAGSTPRNDDGDRAMAGRFAVMNETVEAVRHEFAARGILEVVDASRTADAVFESVLGLLQPFLMVPDLAS